MRRVKNAENAGDAVIANVKRGIVIDEGKYCEGVRG